MLDLAFIRANPEVVKDAARRKRVNVDIDALLELDGRVQEAKRETEMRRAAQNRLSKQMQSAGKDKDAREQLIAEGRELAAALKELEPRLRELEAQLQEQLLLVPNIPDASVPDGRDEDDNVEIKRWGEPTRFEFEPLDHVTLMQRLDLLDLERGAKV
ncbi:MAG TPA: serine--tRNA ligase, partial [Ktedonobacterales bacterium]|nr:serine--tRNA ligase [Ktedonobacterales bacterium]